MLYFWQKPLWKRLIKWLFWLLPVLGLISLTLVILMSVSIAAPGEVDTLKQWQEQINLQRDALSQEHDRLLNVEKAALGYLKNLENKVQIVNNKIQDYEYQLKQANKQLQDLQIYLLKAQNSYAPKLKATVSRLRFLQRQPLSNQGWDILLKSENLNEFIDRRQRLKLVYEADQENLLKLQKQADQIKQQQIAIENQKNQIALIQQQLLAQKAQFESQSSVQQQLIDRLNSDRQALNAAENQLNKDSESIGILIRQRVAQQYRIPRGKGKLIYPNEGRITSSFGWRYHPILKSKRLHSGVDFGGSYGSTIRAADKGRVIFAGWYGGYGNAIVIDHGKGITTLYGHASKLYVKEGVKVERGRAIAAVGSTGLSTGPHLHFEVRENGKPVNPMNYL